MPTLSELHIYPIKSCAGLSLQRAKLSTWGLEYDRNWMVTDTDGQFLTQRECAQLACVKVEFGPRDLHISAPGMVSISTPLALSALAAAPRVNATIWDLTFAAFDTGAISATWFSTFLQRPARLLRFDPRVTRLADPSWSGGMPAPTQFSDGFPLLLIGQASLDDLNAKLVAKGARAIPMNRFRPNLVIDGLAAFEEDYTATLTLQSSSGAVVLRPAKPCPRCPIPTIDQALGQRDPMQANEPTDTLATYRANPRLDGALAFGQNTLIVDGVGAWLEVGQQVAVELDFSD